MKNKRQNRMSVEEWTALLDGSQQKAGSEYDNACENAGFAGVQIADRLPGIACGVINGGTYLLTELKQELLKSDQLLTRSQALNVRAIKFWYAFVNDPAISIGTARGIMTSCRSAVAAVGGDTKALVRFGSHGWIIECLRIDRDALRELLWDCWAEHALTPANRLDELKQVCFDACEEFLLD